MSLLWVVVVLLVLGGGIVAAWRLRSVGSWGAAVFLEVAALLYMVAVFVGNVVAPLLRMGNRTYIESRQEGSLAWQVDDLPVTLNDAGVAAVYDPGRTTDDGWAPISCLVQVDDQCVRSYGYLTDPQTTASVKFAHPGWADFMATTGSTVLSGLIVVAAVFFLWRVVRTIRWSNPFDPGNARRLYTAGVLFLAGAVFSWLSASFTFVALADLSDYVDWSVTFDLNQFLLGLVVVMVAEVFRQGIRLRHDTEGLV